MQPRTFIAAVIVAMIAGATAHAGAVDLDHTAGLSLAERWCAECHQVVSRQGISLNPVAPPFAEIAAGPGVSELSLRLLLQSDHETMPQIRMTADQMDELVGYIMSLSCRGK